MAIDPNMVYESIRFWLPLTAAVGLYFKLKKGVSEWASSLLDNHLTHIQDATQTTASNFQNLSKNLTDHQEKEMQVWAGVVRTLDLIEDRTSGRRLVRRRKK